MKKLLTAVLVMAMCLSLTACGKTQNIVTGYKSGDVTLGEYKGLKYTPESTEVTEEDVDSEIEYFLSSNAENVEITDRTVVKKGDIANIDYVGTMDGVEFEGGKAEDYDLTIGSGAFIPGFEDGLIGAEVGSTVVVDVTFPDPYQNNPDFAGKPAQFTVTVNGIYEEVKPELTDALVAEKTDYESIDAYRESLRSQLKAEKESNARSAREYDIINQAIANATFNKDLTEEITAAKDNMIAQYNEMYQSYYGYDAATIFGIMYGMDAATFDNYMYEQSEMNVKYGYLASAIVEEEKITVTDEEINTLAESMLASYGFTTVEELYAELKSYYNKDGKTVVGEQAKLNKAADIMYGSAIAE